MATVYSHNPKSLKTGEIDDYCAFVVAGGEVASQGLKHRVLNAVQIALLREDRCLLGVAGLKRPTDNHRAEVAKWSGIRLDAEAFPFELGWVYILPSARGRKLSLPLCETLVTAALGKGVFATSRANSVGMHKTLVKLGFGRIGSEWPSKQGNGNLVLFAKDAV